MPSHGGQGGEEQWLLAVERELARQLVPRGMEDERAKQLKYDLHWCLTRNDWYFTAGGILLGGALSWMSGSTKPFLAAIILAPAADWAYGRHVCAELEEAYKEHKRALRDEYRQQLDTMRQQVRAAHYGDSDGGGRLP